MLLIMSFEKCEQIFQNFAAYIRV